MGGTDSGRLSKREAISSEKWWVEDFHFAFRSLLLSCLVLPKNCSNQGDANKRPLISPVRALSLEDPKRENETKKDFSLEELSEPRTDSSSLRSLYLDRNIKDDRNPSIKQQMDPTNSESKRNLTHKVA